MGRIAELVGSETSVGDPAACHAHPVWVQDDSGWSLLCQEEGTWFLAGVADLSGNCVRPRVFSPLHDHGPWISHVARGAYLEDQLAWDWGPDGEETEPHTCPPHTEHGGEQEGLWGLAGRGIRSGVQDSAVASSYLSLACGLQPEASPEGLLWPWLAEVHVAGDRVCAGILVAPSWVLAATHCVLRWVSSHTHTHTPKQEPGRALGCCPLGSPGEHCAVFWGNRKEIRSQAWGPILAFCVGREAPSQQ